MTVHLLVLAGVEVRDLLAIEIDSASVLAIITSDIRVFDVDIAFLVAAIPPNQVL